MSVGSPSSAGVALVTGGATGLGAAIVHRLARAGYDIALCYHTSKDRAADVAAEVRRTADVRCVELHADVSSFPATREMIRQAIDAFGQIDVVVNNAGIRHDQMLALQPLEALWAVMSTNFGGVVNVSKAVCTHMMARRSGRIVNITSISGRRGVAGQTAYSSSKAAIEGFTRSFAKESGPLGVTMACVAPGLLATDMAHGLSEQFVERYLSSSPLPRLGTAEEVAEAVAQVIALGPLAQGQVFVVDGGVTA